VGDGGRESRQRLDLAKQVLALPSFVRIEQRQGDATELVRLLAPRLEPLRPRELEARRVERVERLEKRPDAVGILTPERLAADQPVDDERRFRRDEREVRDLDRQCGLERGQQADLLRELRRRRGRRAGSAEPTRRRGSGP